MTSRWIAAGIAALLLAGCAGMDRVLGMGPSAQGPGRAAYAAVDRAKVFSHPDVSASVLGVLKRHEKLARYQSESGFAWVEAAGNLSGWVREGELVEAPPRPRKQASPAEPAPPSETPPEPEAPEEAEEQEAPPDDAEPMQPERSVFDPY